MDHPDRSDVPSPFPREPIDRVVGPLSRFLHVEAASGVVLLAAAVLAFAAANSPWADAWLGFWKTPVGFRMGGVSLDHSLKHWVSDGLMAIFFFVVGLEVKREIVLGRLRDLRQAALPLAAALGGMVVPALLYLAIAGGGPAERGWGIPMATDIAFVVGCLAVLGSRAPASLRVLLLSLAIADDIGAVLVIAIGYTTDLDLVALGLGFAGIAVVLGMRGLGVRAIPLYWVVGAHIWVAFHESGVHATIAGVILGLITPTKAWIGSGGLAQAVTRVQDVWRGTPDALPPAEAGRVERAAREAVSPLVRLENGLHPWSAFVIMPVFALANAGVAFDGALATDTVALAVGVGLVVGKPVGIVLFSWVAVRAGLARLPDDVGWDVVAGGGLLAGIGFTMSLFIANLALAGETLDAAKVGILGASLLAGAAGMATLVARLPARASG